MTPARLKAIRAATGLTQTELALVLGLKPDSGRQTIRRWETGAIPITGPAAIVMQLIETGELPDRYFRDLELPPLAVRTVKWLNEDRTKGPAK